MGTLYLDRRGMELRVRDGTIELRADGERLRSVAARLVERVVMRADTLVGSASLAALAELGVGVVALGGRDGTRVAHLLGAPVADARARIAQCMRVGDEAWATAWSRRVVGIKLANQRRFLARALAARPDLRKSLMDALGTLDLAHERLADAADRAAVRGHEGGGAAAYFRAYAGLFAPALGFERRRRRPPPDPVNACLSLGYTLLHAQAVQACWASGLDPMVGFLHMPVHGRHSLACDLVEPWRAALDEWVWVQFRERNLRPDQFGGDGAGACVMGKAARAVFYQSVTPLQKRCGAGMRRQARLAARVLAGTLALPDAATEDMDEDEAWQSGFEAGAAGDSDARPADSHGERT